MVVVLTCIARSSISTFSFLLDGGRTGPMDDDGNQSGSFHQSAKEVKFLARIPRDAQFAELLPDRT